MDPITMITLAGAAVKFGSQLYRALVASPDTPEETKKQIMELLPKLDEMADKVEAVKFKDV